MLFRSVPDGAIRIHAVRSLLQEHRYRTPYKFGGVPVDRATILDVEIDASGPDGKRVTGFGSMPLGNVWSFPTRTLPYDVTLGAMKGLAGRIERIVAGRNEVAHPLELSRILEPELAKAAAEESGVRNLSEPIPPLAILVTASAFDAALHDACGKSLGTSAFLTLSPELIGHDLSRYLGDDFRGENLQDSIRPAPAWPERARPADRERCESRRTPAAHAAPRGRRTTSLCLNLPRARTSSSSGHARRRLSATKTAPTRPTL